MFQTPYVGFVLRADEGWVVLEEDAAGAGIALRATPRFAPADDDR
ncbi:MAG TPA: hypothetical protein VE401_07725 [Solirubrobacterales bacterium]|nr:hypothetical protein [Solirubrobacterales bacterium]